jgi:hypothetical protein
VNFEVLIGRSPDRPTGESSLSGLQLAEIVYHQLSGDSPKTKFPPPPAPPGKAS